MASNSLLGMEAVRALLGMDPAATGRTTRRRLRAVAEARCATDFQLVKLAGQWFTTDADLRALIPELYSHEDRGADSLHDVVADVVAELAMVRKRLAAAEGALLALRTAPPPRALPARRQAHPGQLDLVSRT
jgi:hypothetical protein